MSKCNCGNTAYGFNCACDWMKKNPGHVQYSCSWCGFYSASKPRCEECEAEPSIELNVLLDEMKRQECNTAQWTEELDIHLASDPQKPYDNIHYDEFNYYFEPFDNSDDNIKFTYKGKL